MFRRREDAIVWASRTQLPSPPRMGEIEAEVIERTRPGMLVAAPPPTLDPATLDPDERAVLLARTRVLTILGERGAIAPEVRERAATLPLGAWSQLDEA